MPSVLGLLEARERDAARRLEVLREEAERVLTELRNAELSWERFVIAREAVVEVLAGPDGGEESAAPPAGASEPMPIRGGGAVAGSVVPTWSEGLEVSVLAPEYQRIVAVVAASQAALTCKELVSGLGVEQVAAKVEGVRSKANRLVDRGWLVKEPSGRFTLAAGSRGVGS